ncbi:MAG: exopolyphosphatase [Sphingobacteriaceae bacterium]|nr:exopolyphosphatase [Sphingobacteriaceae bacterium]
MNNRAAVIDLGTNTFHLLIAESENGVMKPVFRRTEAVKLGEGGINDGLIQAEPFERGLRCMESFAEDIARHDVANVNAIATSAIRNARNRNDFVDGVKQKVGISIRTIDGLQEARFIYQGIKAAGCLSADNSLVMDIGGGSIEFIIGNIEGIKWKHSFEIGAARMMGLFHQVDPLPDDAIQSLFDWLEEKLQILFEAVVEFPVTQLIGSAGSFESFAEMIEFEKENELDISAMTSYNFEMKDFLSLAVKLCNSSHTERLKMKGLASLRTDMIVTAAILTKFVIEKLGIQKLSMTTYSLKEGVMAEMLS